MLEFLAPLIYLRLNLFDVLIKCSFSFIDVIAVSTLLEEVKRGIDGCHLREITKIKRQILWCATSADVILLYSGECLQGGLKHIVHNVPYLLVHFYIELSRVDTRHLVNLIDKIIDPNCLILIIKEHFVPVERIAKTEPALKVHIEMSELAGLQVGLQLLAGVLLIVAEHCLGVHLTLLGEHEAPLNIVDGVGIGEQVSSARLLFENPFQLLVELLYAKIEIEVAVRVLLHLGDHGDESFRHLAEVALEHLLKHLHQRPELVTVIIIEKVLCYQNHKSCATGVLKQPSIYEVADDSDQIATGVSQSRCIDKVKRHIGLAFGHLWL